MEAPHSFKNPQKCQNQSKIQSISFNYRVMQRGEGNCRHQWSTKATIFGIPDPNMSTNWAETIPAVKRPSKCRLIRFPKIHETHLYKKIQEKSIKNMKNDEFSRKMDENSPDCVDKSGNVNVQSLVSVELFKLTNNWLDSSSVSEREAQTSLRICEMTVAFSAVLDIPLDSFLAVLFLQINLFNSIHCFNLIE